ncbi:uncharacterized protein LOC130808939 [Amaranthus tricolor]|uniref:uncharacterized protein LOC130808939 n=1 Tax=Amaranthus tricolor TaxID=29722 RepID=UPI002584A48D|nr:uncharacterized protein LOC130808939 [Amaranthus tricolor]
MGPQSTMSSNRALEGVHGVQVVPHAPFVVEEVTQHGDQRTICKNSNSRNNRHILMERVQQHISYRFRPVHCCLTGDQTVAETVANVVTSLPFIALGVHAPRKNLNSRMYANSLIGVGLASSLYHCSRGRIRKFLRWVDYTMIATTTVCLSRALRSEHPKLLMAASAVCLPFQPLMVSVVHTGLMEVAFAQRAIKDPELRMVHNVHKACSLLGGVLFVADDVFPQIPFIHAAWHLAAAVGVGTCNKLLE